MFAPKFQSAELQRLFSRDWGIETAADACRSSGTPWQGTNSAPKESNGTAFKLFVQFVDTQDTRTGRSGVARYVFAC